MSGYALDLNVNGFNSNANVGWNVVHPESNTVATYGYFSTNSTGGFNETAFVEGDLQEGTYELHVFDDSNEDGVADQGANENTVSVSVPCK